MSRAAQAIINTAALKHNLQRVRDAAPDTRVMAVVKANGYGHGITRVAKALQDADAFGVASMEEALQVKDAGIQKPIILLEGMFEASEVNAMQQHRFQPVLHSQYQIDMLFELAKKNPHGIKISVWLKLDTGMNRLGFDEERLTSAYTQLLNNPIVSDVGLMTHLANADDIEDSTTTTQIQHFEKVASRIEGRQSIANSAGILGWPASHKDTVRPGVMLYGVNPFVTGTAADHQPAR